VTEKICNASGSPVELVDEQLLRCEPSEGVGAPLDVLVVATKAYDVHAALDGVRSRIADTTAVVLLCNGALAVADELTGQRGALLVATSTQGAWSRGTRDVHHAGKGETWVGSLGRVDVADAERTEAAQRFFASHGLGAHAEDAAATERRLWLKLAANAVLNPLTAHWDCQNGEVLRRAEGREITRAVCEEIAQVAQLMASEELAQSLGADELVQFVNDCAEHNAQNFSSMCMDVRHGRRTEIEELNGWIARKSHELGLASSQPNGTWLGKNEELASIIRARHPSASG